MDAEQPEITSAAPRFCTECGGALPAPGEACPACPQFDARRREIVARYGKQLDELRVVDADENAQGLRDKAAAARAAVAPAQEGTKPLEAAVEKAIAEERTAEDRLRKAKDNLKKAIRAEKRAERDEASPKKQRKALTRKRDTAEIAEKFAAAAGRKTADRVKAEHELKDHEARVAALDDIAVAKERDAKNPPEQVPPSVWTAALAHPLGLVALPDLAGQARALVAKQIADLAELADVADDLRAEGRAALEAELADRTRHPAFARPLGGGNLAVYPNPLNPQTPQAHGPLGPTGPFGLRP